MTHVAPREDYRPLGRGSGRSNFPFKRADQCIEISNLDGFHVRSKSFPSLCIFVKASSTCLLRSSYVPEEIPQESTKIGKFSRG